MNNTNNIITNINEENKAKSKIKVKRQESTFATVDNLIVDNYDLSPTAKLAYAAIADFAQVGFFKSVKELTKLASCSRSTFNRRLNELIENEYIERKNKFNDTGQQKVNEYILNDLSYHDHHQKYSKIKSNKDNNSKNKVIDKRYRNFTRVDSLILYDEGLSWKAKTVYIALARLASEGGYGYSFPSIDTLKKMCNAGRNSVFDGIDELINHGYLIKFRRRTATRRTSNLYYLLNLEQHPFRYLYLNKKENRRELNIAEFLNKVKIWIDGLEQTLTNPEITGVSEINEECVRDKRRGGIRDKRRGCHRQTIIRTILIKNLRSNKNLMIKKFLKSFINDSKLKFINRTIKMISKQKTKKTLRISKRIYNLLIEFFNNLEQKDLNELNENLEFNIKTQDIESKIKAYKEQELSIITKDTLKLINVKSKEETKNNIENIEFEQFKSKLNILFETDSNKKITQLLKDKELQQLKEISNSNAKKIVIAIENLKKLVINKIINNQYIQVNSISDINLLKIYIYTNNSIERLNEDIKVLFKKVNYCECSINYLVGISRTRFNKNLQTKEDCKDDELNWLDNAANKVHFESGTEVNKAIFDLLENDDLLQVFIDKLKHSPKHDIENYSLEKVKKILRKFRDNVFYIKNSISPRFIFEKDNKDKLQKLLS
jgi:hypothetical protein